MIKKSGIINEWSDIQDVGILELIYPSFVIGIELPHTSFPEAWKYFIHNLDSEAAAKEVGQDAFAQGQFAFFHQYDGVGTAQALLFGVCLPLSSCNESIIQSGLLKAITQMTLPVGSTPPSSELAKTWASMMREIGPIHVTRKPGLVQEALLRVELEEKLYGWLKQHFRFITEFSGLGSEDVRRELAGVLGRDVDPTLFWRSDERLSEEHKTAVFDISDRNRASRRINKTEVLPWKNLNELEDWLIRGNQKLAEKADNISCALVWQNSD